MTALLFFPGSLGGDPEALSAVAAAGEAAAGTSRGRDVVSPDTY
jgi:hypothetical protein